MKYSAAVIGLGNIGLMYDFDEKRSRPSSHSLAFASHPSIQFTAAVDVDEQKAALLKQVSQDTAFYQDSIKMLQAHPELDVVSVCTPPVHHVEDLVNILKYTSAKLVICEKPVAATLLEANRILELSKRYKATIVPNITRRWLAGFRCLKEVINGKVYGALMKVEARYTRGIYNTGSHLFDLIRWLAGDIHEVFAFEKVSTSADASLDSSYSFLFRIHDNIYGVAEAFDDRNYYMFEMDLYFTSGKIEIRMSGDSITYFRSATHPLFTGFQVLEPERAERDVLSQSAMEALADNVVKTLDGIEKPFCMLEDAIFPLRVAIAIEQSFCSKHWEIVR